VRVLPGINQLAGGDFYVYYSLDENEDAKVPRIAIRMDGKNKIGEIRGIADGQNMESEMMPILNKKLDEFPDKDNYLKSVHDMELLTLIDRKVSHNMELSVDEIRFLYEADRKIIGFGQREDPRINEIKQKRNKVKDYNLVFKYNKEFNGDLDLRDLTSVEGLDLTGVNIGGSLNLSGLTSTEGLKLPESIGGGLVLSGLTSAEGLDLTRVNIGGALDLSGLTSAEGLDLTLTNIWGTLYLSGLTCADGLELPKNINRSLDLSGLTCADGLELPKNINGFLNLSGLKNAKGLDLSGVNIGDALYLDGLTSAEGLDLSGVNIGDTLNLSRLTSTEGLKLPESIGRNLNLRGLTSTEGLKLPESIGGTLNLSGLTSAKDLDLSGANIGNDLYLSGLTSAEGLDLTRVNIGGALDLSGLTSAEGLKLPKSIGGTLNLSGLTSAEGLMLPYDFDLDNLRCNDDIKEEIRNNHDKYFAKPPVEEELNEAAAQKFNDETETLVINGNSDKKVAYVKKYDGTVEKIPYSKNMDKFISEQKAAMERGESSRFFEISSDPEVAKGQVEALEEVINRNNNLASADNSKQSDGNAVDESMNVHRTR